MGSWNCGSFLKSMEFGSKEDLDDDDILPDTNIDRERTTTGRWAIFVFIVSATFMTVAMVSPNWIEADQRFYGTKVQRVGLWVHCFRSFPDYNDPEHQRFYAGCRWLFNPFTPGYDQIRNFLAPPFFVATQFFYTLSFIAMLIAIIFVVMYLLCVDEYYRVNVLRWTGIDLIIGGAFGTVALIIFGALGDGRDFMPDWEHNYLFWSWPALFEGKRLLGRNNILWSREFKSKIRYYQQQENNQRTRIMALPHHQSICQPIHLQMTYIFFDNKSY